MDKILVTRSSMPDFEEYVEQIRPLWESRWLTNSGFQHQELTRELKKYLNVNNLELFANGHLALEIALQALEIKGEVITTPFTFLSTTNSIVRSGLKPVFCDIDPTRWTIDPQKIRALINKNTVAIMAVHVYGIPCYFEEIEKVAKEYNLKVIYDAAHTFGEKYKGTSISNYGDISMFSFHATKVFHTVEGGALCFKDKELEFKLQRIRDFGLCIGGEDSMAIGTNAKMSEFHAAMGLCNIRHLDGEIAKRRECTKRYDAYFKGVKGIQIFPEIDDLERNYAYYPVVFSNEFKLSRDQVCERLAKDDILARKYFYPLISDFSTYKTENMSETTPIAKAVSDNVVCLPMYADLDIKDIDRICDIILN